MINLASKETCTGCAACVDVCPLNAIVMSYDNDGFKYPQIDYSKCIECHLCERKCPALSAKEINHPYLKTYAGYSSNPEILLTTTSGGFATELSQMIIQDGGLVAGVRYSPDFLTAEYSLAGHLEGLNEFKGSKYVQSEKNKIYTTVRQKILEGNKVLFIGCPCDIAGLHNTLGNTVLDNLLTCELVCMGVGSPKVAEEFINNIYNKYKSPIKSLCARSKVNGWFVPTLEIKLENGKSIKRPLYASYLGRGLQVYNRPSCFKCKYRDTNGFGDIRIGDFWGIKKTDPYWNRNGVSCIFVRSEKGMNAVNRLQKLGFKLFDVEYSTATNNNMSSTLNKGNKYEQLSHRFFTIFVSQGLKAACKATSDLGFRIKRLIPAALQPSIKRIYHFLRDK